MKVRIEFTIDVDSDAWTLNYGVEGAAEIRADVKGYVESNAVTHMQSIGLFKES